MNDFLLELSKNPTARRFIDSLGLPLTLPEPLPREKGPWKERPLDGVQVATYSGRTGELSSIIAETLIEAGADITVLDGPSFMQYYASPAEAWARKAEPGDVATPPEDKKVGALVVDATGFDGPAALRNLYDFLHAWARSIRKAGRVVVLARSPEGADPTGAATRSALEGFVRSLAKEVGRRGTTANLLFVDRGAEERLPGTLRFIMSARSAFITGQPIHVSRQARPSASAGWTRSLKGKVALVTGAARGIGEATASRLAEEGATVICADRPVEDAALSEVARRIGGSIMLLDVAADDASDRLLEEVRSQHGHVDIVVHNAGVTRDKTLGRMSPEAWDSTIAINLAAPIKLTRALLDAELLRDSGRVVCLASVAGIAGNAGQTNYAASKAGLIGFVRSLSQELSGRGITVNAIAPGFIETKMTAAMPAAIREVARRLSALGQGGQPVDVAEAITFLSTPWADGITGTTLRVCGGAFVGA